MKHQHLPAAIMWRYGVHQNLLTCYDGQIENWPEDILGPKPTEAEQAQVVADYEAAGKPLTGGSVMESPADMQKLQAWAKTMGYKP